MTRIATWNLKRPKLNGWKRNPQIIKKLKEINADLWILTETNASIRPFDPSNLDDPGDNYFSVSTLPLARYHDLGENTASIWTKWPMKRQVETYDDNTAVCVEVESPLGPMIVYGTIITYANDKGANGSSKRWQEHRKEIAEHAKDWLKIRKKHPNHLFLVGGDFNQSRDGSGWYEDKASVDALTKALDDAELKCITDNYSKKTLGLKNRDATIDHICLSATCFDKRIQVSAWESEASDHNGIYVDIG